MFAAGAALTSLMRSRGCPRTEMPPPLRPPLKACRRRRPVCIPDHSPRLFHQPHRKRLRRRRARLQRPGRSPSHGRRTYRRRLRVRHSRRTPHGLRRGEDHPLNRGNHPRRRHAPRSSRELRQCARRRWETFRPDDRQTAARPRPPVDSRRRSPRRRLGLRPLGLPHSLNKRLSHCGRNRRPPTRLRRRSRRG
jgi:hypothetical protein